MNNPHYIMNNPHSSQQTRLLITTLFIAGIIFCTFFLLFKPIPLTASDELPTVTSPNESAVDCVSNSQIPAVECLALVELYTTTEGTHWANNNNWLLFGSNAPCDWAGVTCSNGHVIELMLPGNRLSGTLPLSIGNLPALTQLRLENNRLRGRIPPTLCRLAPQLTDTNLAYNAFFTKLRSVEKCMKKIDADWQTTQTIAPKDLRISAITTDTIHLAWTPISYTSDSGYYEIGISNDLNGPYKLHGKTANKSASSYVIDGLRPGHTYHIALRTVTEQHTEQPDSLTSAAIPELAATQSLSGSVLLMAYFPADNDLASEIDYVIERYRSGSQRNPNVQVLMLVDGKQADDTMLLLIAKGVISITDVVTREWGIGELDTANPAVLAWFLNYGRDNYPAERTVVALMGHGIPPAPEIDFSTSVGLNAAHFQFTDNFPPLPREHDALPSDITNRGYFSTVDLGQALMAASQNGTNPFDIVFFDQCFQGNLDILYEVHKTAKVFIASPNYAWLVASYNRYLAHLLPNSSPEAMSLHILSIYQDTLDRNHPNAILSLRGQDIPLIADAVNTLADTLSLATQAGETTKIANAVKQSKYVDTTQCGSDKLELGPPDALIGVDTFVENLQGEFKANDLYGVFAASEAVSTTLGQIRKLARTGNPYLAPDEFWDYRDSITLLAPLQRNSDSRTAWRASLYRSEVPFTATWILGPNQPVTITASLAYAREGRWDDFLAGWYQNLEPTVGVWCHYTPIQQVLLDDAGVLSLTAVALGIDGVRLEWTPTDDSEATRYLVLSKRPRDVSWRVADVLSLDSTTISLSDLISGTYRFRVLARNSNQEFVAVSKDATVSLLEEEEMNTVFLPLINRE